MRKPNLFLVGAPKCGTTAMSTYLSQHPDIYMSPIKELNFFVDDIFHYDQRNPKISEKIYLSFFDRAQHETYIAEASTWYLYSQEAASKIKAFSPDAKIIIMLRNPVDMIYSLHSQMVYSGFEHITDFEKALEAEERRRIGLDLPKYNLGVLTGKLLLYREIAKYTNQVKRYLNVFDRNNVHIIIFDDLRDNPLKVYKELLLFLAIRNDFIPEFKNPNPSHKRRIQGKWLQKIRHHPLILDSVQFLVSPVVRRRLYESMTYLYRKINTVYVERPEMSLESKKNLQAYYYEDIHALSDLIGRNLTFWIT